MPEETPPEMPQETAPAAETVKAAVEKPIQAPETPVDPSETPVPSPTPTAAVEPAPARAKPAAVEAKPLADYLKEDLQPLLLKRLQAEGAADLEITTGEAELTATWDAGDKTFTLYFDEGSLDGRKTIASSRAKSRGKNVQMFMPPERGFKGVDAKTITAMIVMQFTTTLSWIKKPLAKVGAKAGAKAGKPK